jgi:gas vesicle protein
MYYDDESGALTFAAGILLGAVLGASLALLTAPQSGRRTRKRLIQAVASTRDVVGDRWGELGGELQDVVRSSRKRIRL